MNGQEKLNAIIAETENGNTVNIWAEWRVTPVKQSTFKSFHKAGYDLFKVDANDSLYIRNGKRWDCIDFNRITVEKK